MKKIYLWLLLPLLIFGGCESLEDTYKDYAGDGPIRYLVKCDDLDVKAGWNRLVVSWKSVDDPIIDKVKVSWTVDGSDGILCWKEVRLRAACLVTEILLTRCR